jgi:predicted phosphodiesterase
MPGGHTSKILVIGDAHAKPGVSNRRFDWLGKFIADTKPDVVVDIGDWADMESLSSYDKGKRSFEGRRYKKDVEAALDARERVNYGMRSMPRRPTLIALTGNHEDRIARAAQSSPELHGTLKITDVQQSPLWRFIPFLETYHHSGFAFQHYFTTGILGKAQAGESPALNLIRKQIQSCVMGHTHLFDYAERRTATGKKFQAFVAGCYLDPLQWEEYAGPTNKFWWRGLLLLENAKDGYAESWRRVGIGDLQREYGR